MFDLLDRGVSAPRQAVCIRFPALSLGSDQIRL